MSGYDKRSRFTKTTPARLFTPSSGALRSTRSHYQSQTTVSYRSEPSGEPVFPADIDPYGFLLESVADRRRRSISDTFASGRALPGRFIKSESDPITDNGHPFWTVKRSMGTSARGQNYFVRNGTSSGNIHYGGPGLAVQCEVTSVSAQLMPFNFGTSSDSLANQRTFRPNNILVPPQENLNEYGMRAINTLAPGTPPIDTFAMVGELLTGFPRLMGMQLAKQAGNASSALSGEFLNLVFGILPTLSDVQKLISQLTRVTEAVFQLQRDQGTGVRRRMDFPVEQANALFEGTQLARQGGIHVGGSYGYNVRGGTGSGVIAFAQSVKSQLVMQRKKTISFSGSFSYAIPLPTGFSGRVGEYLTLADRVLGLSPNLSASWQLTPWSWLADWIYDIGSVLDLYRKVQDDNFVINYGYVMCTTEHRATQHTELAFHPGYESGISYADTWSSSLRKERIRANPFGFIPLDAPEINPMRLAILAALGLSRR